jgi:hypothetical protein
LEDLLRLEEIAQAMLAEIDEFDTTGKCPAGQLLDRLREEDLAAIS